MCHLKLLFNFRHFVSIHLRALLPSLRLKPRTAAYYCCIQQRGNAPKQSAFSMSRSNKMLYHSALHSITLSILITLFNPTFISPLWLHPSTRKHTAALDRNCWEILLHSRVFACTLSLKFHCCALSEVTAVELGS